MNVSNTLNDTVQTVPTAYNSKSQGCKVKIGLETRHSFNTLEKPCSQNFENLIVICFVRNIYFAETHFCISKWETERKLHYAILPTFGISSLKRTLLWNLLGGRKVELERQDLWSLSLSLRAFTIYVSPSPTGPSVRSCGSLGFV